MSDWRILQGDALEVLRTLDDESVHCCVTSPPYWGLRDYGTAEWDGGEADCDHDGTDAGGTSQRAGRSYQQGHPMGVDCRRCGAIRIDQQLGLERTPEEYVEKLVEVFREVRRVLRDDGTVWLNLGDSYSGSGKGGNPDEGKQATNKGSQTIGTLYGKTAETARRCAVTNVSRQLTAQHETLKPKDLIGIPWRVALALQADGWYLRSDIIWSKPNPMPESVTDRPTKAHEYIFLLAKSAQYYYDADSIRESPSPSTLERWSDPYTKQRPDGEPTQAFIGGESMCGVSFAGRNKRTVWTVATQPYPEAHFATFPPKLIEPCILAGCPGPKKICDCDELILSPIGSGATEDPSMKLGRAGYNRIRRDNEGTRPITRREQREYAKQMKGSQHCAEMEKICGSPFAHYIRTDKSGGRPLPAEILESWLECGWLKKPDPCSCPVGLGGTVLDPFAGAGTTGLVALRFNRKFIGIELNPDYVEMTTRRIEQDAPLFNMAVAE